MPKSIAEKRLDALERLEDHIKTLLHIYDPAELAITTRLTNANDIRRKLGMLPLMIENGELRELSALGPRPIDRA